MARRSASTLGSAPIWTRVLESWPGHGEDAAGPAVFEGAREHPLIIGGERGGDGVAGEARDIAALEGEADGLAPVDQPAEGIRQAVDAAGHFVSPLAAKSTRRLKTSPAG